MQGNIVTFVLPPGTSIPRQGSSLCRYKSNPAF